MRWISKECPFYGAIGDEWLKEKTKAVYRLEPEVYWKLIEGKDIPRIDVGKKFRVLKGLKGRK